MNPARTDFDHARINEVVAALSSQPLEGDDYHLDYFLKRGLISDLMEVNCETLVELSFALLPLLLRRELLDHFQIELHISQSAPSLARIGRELTSIEELREQLDVSLMVSGPPIYLFSPRHSPAWQHEDWKVVSANEIDPKRFMGPYFAALGSFRKWARTIVQNSFHGTKGWARTYIVSVTYGGVHFR